MKICFNTINFGNNKPRIIVDKDSLGNTRRVEYDTFGRDVDSKLLDKNGIVSEHQHKVYYEKDNEKVVLKLLKINSKNIQEKHIQRPRTDLNIRLTILNQKPAPKPTI